MNKSVKERIRILYGQELGLAKIAKEVGVSYATVRKILIDCGDLETAESQLYKQGFSVSDIAEMLEKKREGGQRPDTIYQGRI